MNLVQESARLLQMTRARQMRVDKRDLPEAQNVTFKTSRIQKALIKILWVFCKCPWDTVAPLFQIFDVKNVTFKSFRNEKPIIKLFESSRSFDDKRGHVSSKIT